MVVRPYTWLDVEEVFRGLSPVCVQEIRKRGIGPRYFRVQFIKGIGKPWSLCFATDKDQPAALMMLTVEGRDGICWFCHNNGFFQIYRGIAREIRRIIRKYAKAQGLDRVIVNEPDPSLETIRWILSCGFQRVSNGQFIREV